MMRLCVINNQLDEAQSSYAWQAAVIYRLAQHVEEIVVFTSRVGEFKCPGNVTVELIPERPFGLPQRFGGSFLLNAAVFRRCRSHRIDAVFIHMTTGWAYRLYPTFQLLRIPVTIWHEHAQVGLPYHLAVLCADRVISGSREGAGTKSKKLRVIGHAVDMDRFVPPSDRRLDEILSISRIAPVKRLEVMVDLLAELQKMGLAHPMQLVGGPLTPRDFAYQSEILQRIQDKNLATLISLPGLVTKPHLKPYYERAFVTLNFSLTNSLDAAVIESLASGCPVLTTSPSFFSMLAAYPEFIARDLRPAALAEQVTHIYAKRHDYVPERLRQIVVDAHSLASYPQRLLPHIRSRLASPTPPQRGAAASEC